VATDLLQRIAPRRYFDVVKRLEPFMRQTEAAAGAPPTEAAVTQPSANGHEAGVAPRART
jgi:hypothetical protein